MMVHTNQNYYYNIFFGKQTNKQKMYHVIHAVIHPPATNDKKSLRWWGLDIREGEIDSVVKKWRWLPLFIKHQHDSKPCGWVTHFERGTNNELNVYMVVNSSHPRGKEAFEGIDSGKFLAVSLGQMGVQHPVTKKIAGIIPLEVSLCEKGGRDGTFIKWYTGKDLKQNHSQFYKSQIEIIKKLEERQLQMDRVKQLEEELAQAKAQAAADATAAAAVPNVIDPNQGMAEPQLTGDPVTDELNQLRHIAHMQEQQLNSLRRFSPDGDVSKLSTLMENEERLANEKKLTNFRGILETLRKNGGFGMKENMAKEVEDRISETPPILLEAFAEAGGNIATVAQNLAKEQIEAFKKDHDDKLQAEKKARLDAETRLKEQQATALKSQQERWGPARAAATQFYSAPPPYHNYQTSPQYQQQQQQQYYPPQQQQQQQQQQAGNSRGVVFVPQNHQPELDNYPNSSAQQAVKSVVNILSRDYNLSLEGIESTPNKTYTMN